MIKWLKRLFRRKPPKAEYTCKELQRMCQKWNSMVVDLIHELEGEKK